MRTNNNRWRGRIAAAAVAAAAMLVPAPAHAAGGPDGFAGAPPRTGFVEIDLFRAFTDCLAEAAHGDSMYPGIDPAEVNRCLADYGF
jgi:hypothetical protein